MKKILKALTILIVISFIVPQIVLASWWNPFSWGVWSNIQSVFSTIVNKPQTASIVSLIDPITEVKETETEGENQTTPPTPTPNLTPISTPTPDPTPAPAPTATPISAPAPVCIPSWQCSNWNICTNSQQMRTCSDLNNCEIATNKPAEAQSCCSSNWQCGSWSTCINSQQTRICTDSNSCGITTGQPALAQSCTVACIPSWQCGSWSTCINSQQTRNCYDSNYCGTASGAPVQTQHCTVVCYPNWQCDSWNTCTNGQQTRTCNDINGCGKTIARPSLTQYCISPIQPILPAGPTVAEQKYKCQDRYMQSELSLERTTQVKRTYYNNIISSIPSADYLADHGLTFSSTAEKAASDFNEAQSALIKIEADYNASLADLQSVLQSCLGAIE